MRMMIAQLLLCVLVASQSVAIPRGVSKEASHRYTPTSDSSFTCLDGSRTIPFDAVNDDFCDCADGSDEPGTSACPNTRFHCQNEHHVAADIPSSRVNDGVCDYECCDGSDEYDGTVECIDFCFEMAEQENESAFVAQKVTEEGLTVKREYLAKKKAEDAQRLFDIAALEPEVAELKKIMDGYWEITNQLEAKERAIKSEYENSPESKIAPAESGEAETSDTPEEAIPDPPEVLAAKKAAQDARAEYNTHFNAYSAKYTQLETIQNLLKMDLGFDGGLGVLLNQCLEHHTHEYTYKLCFFDTAAQKGKDQFLETSLGNWNGFTGKDLTAFSGKNLKYTEGEFINGLGCWQGPQRSVRVSFECGAKNEIVSFSEPNKCEYAARVTTPGLCESDEDVANRGSHKAAAEAVKEVSQDDSKEHGRDATHESASGFENEHDEL